MIDDRTAALRLLLRRGVEPRDVVKADQALFGANATRTARGNISMHLGNVLTGADLDQAKAVRRAKIRAKTS